MLNILKISKIIIYLSLVIFFLSGSIQLFYPDSYASYMTSHSVDSIVEYRNGNLDHNLICKEFFPEEVSKAMGKIWLFSLVMLVISFISILIFQLFLIKKESSLSQSRNTMRNFVAIFSISFLILFMVFMIEYDYDYITGCKQLQENGEFLQ